MRLNRQKFSIRIYKNKVIRLKVKRLLPLNKSSLNNFFSFIKRYSLTRTSEFGQDINIYNKATVNLEKFQFFYKNIFSFFINFKNAFFLKNMFFRSNSSTLNELFKYSYTKFNCKNNYPDLNLINLQPDFSFKLINVKHLWLSKANMIFKENLVP